METAPVLTATQVSGFNVNFYTLAAGSSATQTEVDSLCADLNFDLTENTDPYLEKKRAAGSMEPTKWSNTADYVLTVTWKEDSTVTLSGDVTVSVGESTFVYTQK